MQAPNGLNARGLASPAIVHNQQVRKPYSGDDTGFSFLRSAWRDYLAPPALEQALHSLEYRNLVVHYEHPSTLEVTTKRHRHAAVPRSLRFRSPWQRDRK